MANFFLSFSLSRDMFIIVIIIIYICENCWRLCERKKDISVILYEVVRYIPSINYLIRLLETFGRKWNAFSLRKEIWKICQNINAE